MNKQSGLSLIEVISALAVSGIFFMLVLAGMYSSENTLKKNRITGTKDRIVNGVRTLAGLPASLRNAMIAADNIGKAINPELLACAGGNLTNGITTCESNKLFPLTLYSPIVTFTGAVPTSVQPISSPLGATADLQRFDTYGIPCTTAGPDCPILVQTAFKAFCGPALRPPAAPVTQAMLSPQANCRIADSIEVYYEVKLDPSLIAGNPDLAIMIQSTSGTVRVPVIQISGNQPQ